MKNLKIKIFCCTLLLVYVSLSCFAQTRGKVTKEKVFSYVEQMPQFPGGEADLQRYIMTNFKYPKASLEKGVQGTMMARFVVNTDGSVGKVVILKGLDSLCNKEAKRVISSLPHFTPGRQNGKAVKVWYTIPIRLMLR